MTAGPMESMVERCPRFGKWIGGCRFEARYEERSRQANFDGHIYPSSLRKLITIEVYVRDVCVRCGKTVERPALTDQRAGG